jgi:hypothetical protein
MEARFAEFISMESPESWLEDFGRADLAHGQAKVALEAAFATVVHTDDYHVFLSPEGETNGLYVSSRNTAGFEVREQQRGTSNASFSYRIVARRLLVSEKSTFHLSTPRTCGGCQRGSTCRGQSNRKGLAVRRIARRRRVLPDHSRRTEDIFTNRPRAPAQPGSPAGAIQRRRATAAERRRARRGPSAAATSGPPIPRTGP